MAAPHSNSLAESRSMLPARSGLGWKTREMDMIDGCHRGWGPVNSRGGRACQPSCRCLPLPTTSMPASTESNASLCKVQQFHQF